MPGTFPEEGHSHTGAGRPQLTYSYAPQENVSGSDDAESAVLHGRFADLRLAGYTLPGGQAPRVRFEYEASSGRARVVAYPTPEDGNSEDASVSWRIAYTADAAYSTVENATVTAPWGQPSRYVLDSGRVLTLQQEGVPTVPESGVLAPDDEIPVRSLTTGFDYTDEGRVETISHPDGTSTVFTYLTGDRFARASVKTVDRGGYVTTYDYGEDRQLAATIDGENRRTSVPIPYNGAEPKAVGYEAEGVLTTHTFDAYGRPLTATTSGEAPLSVVNAYGEDERGIEDAGPLLSTTSGGIVERYHYDEHTDALVGTETSYGVKSTFARDDWDRAIQEVHGQSTGAYQAVNATVQRGFDAAGRLIRERRHQTGVGWVVTEWEYNARDQVVSVRETGLAGSLPASKALVDGTTHYSYDAYGRLETVESPGGVVTTTTYDSAGRVASTQVPGSGTRRQGYDAMGRVSWTTDGDVGVWRGLFNALGALRAEYHPSGAYVERQFDDAGGLRSEEVFADASKSELLARTSYQVTSFGEVERVEELVSGGGSPVGSIVTETVFDGSGRPVETTTLAGSVSRREEVEYVEGSGLVAAQGDAAGVRTTFVYEAGPWPASVVTTEPADGSHPTIRVETVLSYDALGRVVEQEQAGTVAVKRLDEAGNLLEASVGGASRVLATYDGRGLPLHTTRPAIGGATHYGYDLDGRVLEMQVDREAGQQDVTTYHYDAAGRLDERTRPGSATERLTYFDDDTVDTWTTRLRNRDGVQLEISHEYDAANRLRRRTPSRGPFTSEHLPEGLAPLDSGDEAQYDVLGRPLYLGTRGVDGSPEVARAVNIVGYDTRGLPASEHVGAWPTPFEREYDHFGDPRVAVLPAGVGSAAAAPALAYQFDDVGRLETVGAATATGKSLSGSSFAATLDWVGWRSRRVSTASGLSTSYVFDFDSGRLSTVEITTPGSTLGGFSYGWNVARNLREHRTVLAGRPDLASGLGWEAGYDEPGRLTSLAALSDWGFAYGRADELRFLVGADGGREDVASGVEGRLVGLSGSAGSSVLRYDDEGRRVEDDRFVYTWDWRGRLVQVDLKTPAGSPPGERVVLTYDATGRLLERIHYSSPDAEGNRSFVDKRLMVWDGQRLATQAGLNFEDEVLWRQQYLPGPGWLDDAPLVLVESGLHGATPTSSQYALLRDEMGSVIGVIEEGAGGPPALLARYRYSPYGEAHLERQPELVEIAFDPTRTEAGGEVQEPEEGASVGGTLVIRTTIALAPESLGSGVVLHTWDGADWQLVPDGDFLVAQDPGDPTNTLVMRRPAWPSGDRYRVTLQPSLHDQYGRTLRMPPGDDGGVQVVIQVPDDGVAPPAYRRRFAVEDSSVVAAGSSLGGAFPGGQTAGYHGLWTDPLTGLVYARARWYDPSAPGWLSPDPQMDVDGPNLYAFVAWSPQMYGDPTGEIAESGWDIVSLGFGVTSLGYNLWHRNWGAAGWDAFGVAVDTAALLLPGVPGGVGAATKASRAGRVAVRAAQTAVWAGDAGQGIVQGAEAIGQGQYGWGAFYGGMAAFGGVAGARSLTSALDFNLPGPVMTRADAGFIDNSLTPGFSSLPHAPVAELSRGAQLRARFGGLARADRQAQIAELVGVNQLRLQTLGNRASSRVLGRNMEAIGMSRPAGSAAHHIVAGRSRSAASARRVLGRCGIDINEVANGVFLPRLRSTSSYTPSTYHPGLHTRRYYAEMTRRLRGLRTREEAIEVLEQIRIELLAGRFPY